MQIARDMSPDSGVSAANGMRARRVRRGRRNHYSGTAAEDIAVRHYERLGYRVLSRRWRCAEGEIDLIVRRHDVCAFVEVKLWRPGEDSPVRPRQWRRLEQAASRYMMSLQEQDAVGFWRFDVVLVGPTGEPTLHENVHLLELY